MSIPSCMFYWLVLYLQSSQSTFFFIFKLWPWICFSFYFLLNGGLIPESYSCSRRRGKEQPNGGCFLWRNYTLPQIISTMITSLEKVASAVCTGANFGMDHKYDYNFYLVSYCCYCYCYRYASCQISCISVSSKVILAHFSRGWGDLVFHFL